MPNLKLNLNEQYETNLKFWILNLITLQFHLKLLLILYMFILNHQILKCSAINLLLP